MAEGRRREAPQEEEKTDPRGARAIRKMRARNRISTL